MKSHMISGGAGIQLHVLETGQPRGRPIVFLHGFSQSCVSWTRQLHSDLAAHYRLLALDLRGHGLSARPRDGYSNSQVWADDLHAVIQALELDHPVLCGWSYGPLVILDYLRHYGEEAVAGCNFVGGVTQLGTEEAVSVLTPEFLSLLPGFFSADVEDAVCSLDSLLRLCFTPELSVEDRYRMLGASVSVPPYVRQALFSRAFDNDDLLPKLRKPVLITHGSDDAVVKPAVIEQQMARIPRAHIRLMPQAGHACFWNDTPAYNETLHEFAAAL